jgi:putative ABC transport system ATP-binding protein
MTPIEKPIIEINRLCKDFVMGDQVVHALAGVDLKIMPNTLTVIMGPSGSGKSTLLYLLGGLDRPTSGEIVVNQQAIHKMDENQLAKYRQRTVGFIFQSFNLIPTMNAMQNVAFPMRFARTRAKQRAAQAGELLKRVGLDDRAHHRPTELSGGQQQRVAIARALVNSPEIILADEPTGNLDSASGGSIMHLLSELHRSGRTVIVVTHDSRMNRFATHQVFLLDGRTVTEDEYKSASILDIDEEPQTI